MIYCILVTFKPDLSQLTNTILSIIKQVDKLVIVKNSNEILGYSDEKIHIIQLKKNYGIAYAQNRGIEYAISRNARYVLFSDQDSIYPVDFVKKSINCFSRHTNELVAAVTPYFYNNNKKQFTTINITKTTSIMPERNRDYEIQHAISSGTISPCEVFHNIGMMNERLFIDWVDFEWCWRAIKNNYKIICDTGNIINHNMGDSFKSVLGRKIVVYSDFRNYYFFRNGFYLLFHSRLFNIKDWLRFYKFMKIKTLLFYITCGFSITHIILILKAKYRGITNTFTLEKE